MKRRDFFTTSLLGGFGAVAALTSELSGQEEDVRDFYELRKYHIYPGNQSEKNQRFYNFLKSAAIPAFNRNTINPVGVFTPHHGCCFSVNAKDGCFIFNLVKYEILTLNEYINFCFFRILVDREQSKHFRIILHPNPHPSPLPKGGRGVIFLSFWEKIKVRGAKVKLPKSFR